MMENKIVCFVILHYMGIEETIDCVSSILALDDNSQARIVIVDNASPNNSGKKLQEKYQNNENIFVLLRKANDGFSRGNNEGVDYAKLRWHPDFYVITNNDVLFEQQDFIIQVFDSYKEYVFDVMGPDIYAPVYKVHQNPMQHEPPSLFQVQNTIVKNTVGLIFFPLLKKYIASLHSEGIRKAAVGNNIIIHPKLCLKGACMIYSREYVEEKGKVFAPETYFYYEEFIQAVYCFKKNKTVVYNPNLKVIHMDGQATNQECDDGYQKSKYILKNMLASAKVYRKVLLRGIL